MRGHRDHHRRSRRGTDVTRPAGRRTTWRHSACGKRRYPDHNAAVIALHARRPRALLRQSSLARRTARSAGSTSASVAAASTSRAFRSHRASASTTRRPCSTWPTPSRPHPQGCRGLMNNELTPLIRPLDIATLAGVSGAAVANWRKRDLGFPDPAGGSSNRPLFDRREVLAWLKAQGKTVAKPSPNAVLWSAMDTVRGLVPVERSGLVLVWLLAARKADAEGLHGPGLWDRVRAQDGTSSERLQLLLASALDAATPAPEGMTRRECDVRAGQGSVMQRAGHLARSRDVGNAALNSLMDAVATLDIANLASAGEDVITRLSATQGRLSGEFGTPNSLVSEVIASFATRTNATSTRMSRDDARRGIDRAALHAAIDAALDHLPNSSHARTAYDPVCGIGSTLLAIATSISEPVSLVGTEVDEDIAVLAQLRGYLAGHPIAMVVADSTRCDTWPGHRADLVVAEPPFGLRAPDGLPTSTSDGSLASHQSRLRHGVAPRSHPPPHRRRSRVCASTSRGRVGWPRDRRNPPRDDRVRCHRGHRGTACRPNEPHPDSGCPLGPPYSERRRAACLVHRRVPPGHGGPRPARRRR